MAWQATEADLAQEQRLEPEIDDETEADQGGGRGKGRRRAARLARKAEAAAEPTVISVRPVAGPARAKTRHWGVLFFFLLVVALPTGVSGWYLWTRAVDQYESRTGFSVRKEETGSSVDVLGVLPQLSSGSSSDTDILYQFIQSQDLVARVEARLGLREIYSAPYETDPVFALKPDASIEELLAYWERMVKIYYEPGTGLIELSVRAFDPEAAQLIAATIFDESSIMINRLSAIARDDATRYAREELDQAVERLKNAREAITAFRSRTQIVDPSADIQGQMGLLNTLQQQLAAALIELDLLQETTREGDPRIAQASRRIEVIRARIMEEREKFGIGGEGPGGEDYATLVAEFERLTVDREFAEEAYKAALSAYDGALAEAQRTSRYLAAHVAPTRAETPQYPQRWVLVGLVALFAFLGWSIMVLIYYSVRDRR